MPCPGKQALGRMWPANTENAAGLMKISGVKVRVWMCPFAEAYPEICPMDDLGQAWGMSPGP